MLPWVDIPRALVASRARGRSAQPVLRDPHTPAQISQPTRKGTVEGPSQPSFSICKDSRGVAIAIDEDHGRRGRTLQQAGLRHRRIRRWFHLFGAPPPVAPTRQDRRGGLPVALRQALKAATPSSSILLPSLANLFFPSLRPQPRASSDTASPPPRARADLESFAIRNGQLQLQLPAIMAPQPEKSQLKRALVRRDAWASQSSCANCPQLAIRRRARYRVQEAAHRASRC